MGFAPAPDFEKSDWVAETEAITEQQFNESTTTDEESN